MKTLILSLAVSGALAACTPMAANDASGATTPASPEGPGACKAEQYQSYIGRSRAELPEKPAGETWRVTCTTCPVTMDYSPSRLNIFYDQSTGIIREVKCG